MMKSLMFLFVGVLTTLSAATQATPVTFDPSSSASSVTATPTSPSCDSCSLTATLDPGLGTQQKTLATGDSWTFPLFDLSYSGTGAWLGKIDAVLGFNSPGMSPVADSGNGFAAIGGSWIAGILHWDPISPITLADGSIFGVKLQDLAGFSGARTIPVNATITLFSDPPATVPEPATLAIMGLGLLALLMWRKRPHGGLAA